MECNAFLGEAKYWSFFPQSFQQRITNKQNVKILVHYSIFEITGVPRLCQKTHSFELQLICANIMIALIYFHKLTYEMRQKINESFAQIYL